ncbi:MAG: Ribosome biogenesis protein Nop10 [Candidatus Thorarchaeota archaeon]|nr:MAG: Ribosome biogenesis protein Nop10 [Candidatus Thorarchaeota archaeon]
MTQLYKCIECNKYTLDEKQCPACGGEVRNPNPPKYSPEDKYGKYRRDAKRKAKATKNN